MSEPNELTPNGAAQAAVACMTATGELQARLVGGWLELVTRGIPQPAAVASWSLEAMRLTAETTLRNIEHCQHFAAPLAAGGPK
jgi:hypothetical protein